MRYSDDNRGIIQYRERRKQITDFSGLRIDNITPTDCDGLIEYHGKAYIIIEIKYRDAKVPKGQLTAFTRAIDDFNKIGKSALLIIATHSTDDYNKDIKAAETIVREVYFNKKFYKVHNTKLKILIDRFIAYVDKETN